MIPLTLKPDSGLSNAATTGSLSDPGGPRAGSTAPPSFRELRNPTLHNQKITYDTNTTGSLPLMVRPWSQGFETGFHQGSCIFAGPDCTQHLCTAADIPTLNYLLETSKAQDNIQKPLEKMCPKSLKQLLEDWRLFGVMRNDMMANSMLQKLYNCDVFGRAMIANIFGSKLKRGDTVGLAVQEVADIRGRYQMYVHPNGNLMPGELIVPDGSSPMLQIVGTVNGKCQYAADADKLVHHIPLGVISHAVAKVPSDNFIKRALRESDQYTLLPRIEILMI